jgi:hypothetical protein
MTKQREVHASRKIVEEDAQAVCLSSLKNLRMTEQRVRDEQLAYFSFWKSTDLLMREQ